MNNLTITKAEVMMTSLQIAEALGKPHNEVLKAIRKMEPAWAEICEGNFSLTYRNVEMPNGGTRREAIYSLTKEQFFYIATKYNDRARAKLIRRWRELEEGTATPAYQIPKSFTEALRLAADQQEQIEAQQRQIGMQSEQILQLSTTITSMEKKVTYMDRIFACPSTVKVTVIAQDYGMSAKAFNQLLHKYGLQYKCGEQWVLYAKYLPMGYVKDTPFTYVNTSGIENVKSNMQWTQKGRAFLYEFLKERGILPMIEQ